MQVIALKHGSVINRRKHISEKDVFSQSAALVDHGLQSSVVDRDIGGVDIVSEACILKSRGLCQNDIGARDIGENHAQQSSHIIGGDVPWVASSTDVIGADEDEQEMRPVIRNRQR